MRAYAFITQMSEGQTSNISLLTQSTEMRKILWCPIFPFFSICFSLVPFLFHSICFVFVFYLSRSAYISLKITNQICKSSIATKKKCNKKSNPHFEICLQVCSFFDVRPVMLHFLYNDSCDQTLTFKIDFWFIRFN